MVPPSCAPYLRGLRNGIDSPCAPLFNLALTDLGNWAAFRGHKFCYRYLSRFEIIDFF